MELNNTQSVIENDVAEQNEITTMEQAFARTFKVGKYTFRLKQGLKGKELFSLVNKFAFAQNLGKSLDNQSLMKNVCENCENEFDYIMSYIEYSVNNGKFYPLYANGMCQIVELETNVQLMYQLVFFVYQAIILFMEISQRQLDDMK